jgi:hypothetical protein
MNSTPRKRDTTLVSKAIVVQVMVLAVLAIVVLVLVALDLVDGTLGLGWAAGGLVAGVAVGVVASRIRRMKWDERTGRVIARIDWIGAVILGGFLAGNLAREWVLGHWVEGAELTTLGMCVTAGTLTGQVIGTRRRVRSVLTADPARDGPSTNGGPGRGPFGPVCG